jgi:ABC-type ATPase with predicted acetyltransferase domain
VPFGSVHPHELADGWGLLYVKEDMNVDLIREPDSWDCPEKNKLHLVQNIAISVSKSHLFAHGIQEKSDGKVYFTPIPRRRRPNRGTSV